MAKEKPPFRINSWYNPETEAHGEVWWNGKDGYNCYLNDERVDTWYVPQVPEWTETHSNLLAVGAACRMGYHKTMGIPFPGDVAED